MPSQRPATGSGRNGQAARAGDKASTAQSVAAVVKSGDVRKSLEALRDKLARDLDDAPPSAIAPIAAQLRATLAELAALPQAKKVSKADDLAARRKARIAAADVRVPAAGEDRQ